MCFNNEIDVYYSLGQHFLLIDLREIFLRFWVGGGRGGDKKIKIKSLKLISR